MTLRRLLFSAGMPAAAAAVGGLGARNAPQVYTRLRKPSWAPPSSAFGPVWSLLYAANCLVGWRLYDGERSAALRRLHAAQLAVNASVSEPA